ncbi:fructose-1,6-bisphosphatase/inositol monophosphatase family enzyme [Palleronia aestuarii]|uniref:Fructose-1,6-bisphosphatase/inositol monophosphatase family enzyme n=1 Tax=Palleronia aestuarii TaxID=568105 RepID=A0A2W7MRD2_9RHOB|nr:inositol monophosphatase family protein [Palleronia aestuarii]PZX10133.1 fructose-1,6-bisphosphatase/inositol monophosphatase family enzyme [Palleronia aestuarii]
MIDPTTEQSLIELVRHAARTEIMPRFRNLAPSEIGTKSGPDDLVTIADRRAERVITDELARILPKAAVVGEEACAENPALLDTISSSELCVIVDPVDGTANFAAGLALFGVILAVVHEGRTIFSLLYDPVLDDWVAARAGGGAWYGRPELEPVRMRSRSAPPIDKMQGFLSLHLFAEPARSALAARLPTLGLVRTLRCSCHEYRALALGHADFNISAAAKPWDHAAGLVVLDEAGGASSAGGRRYDPARQDVPILAVADPVCLEPMARHLDLFPSGHVSPSG